MVRCNFREVQEQNVMPATVPRTVTAPGKFTLSQRLKRKEKRMGKKRKIKEKPSSWGTVNVADQHKPVILGIFRTSQAASEHPGSFPRYLSKPA